MDCKGCEYLLTENALKNVDRVKIEYLSDRSHKLKDLLKILENAGFKYMIYKINPFQHNISNNVVGHIYGKKIQSEI
jgi:hypothetical protein